MKITLLGDDALRWRTRRGCWWAFAEKPHRVGSLGVTLQAESPLPPAIFTGRPYVVVYDGGCKVCTRLARVLQRFDTRATFDVVPSQAPGVPARFPWIPPRAFRESLQLVDASGRTWEGASAIERVLDLLPRGAWIAWLFSLPFARPLAERCYRWFARNRYQLGCGAHCQYRPPDVDL